MTWMLLISVMILSSNVVGSRRSKETESKRTLRQKIKEILKEEEIDFSLRSSPLLPSCEYSQEKCVTISDHDIQVIVCLVPGEGLCLPE